MCFAASILLLLSSGQALPRCDFVEINHCTGVDGQESFVQAIAWDWSPQYRRMHCQQWVFVTNYTYEDGIASLSTDNGKLIKIRCKFFRETWTEYDPERENQRVFDPKFRRKVW